MLASAGVLSLGWAGVAHAGYAVSPVSGASTTSQPVFSVYLEPQEQLDAEVYIAASTQMGSYFIPTNLLGSCVPSTPTGVQFTFSCQPLAYYTAGFGSSLPPGTYYWWLTFWQTDPGSFVSTLHISGPLVFTVPAPTPPPGAALLSPADGATVGTEPTLSIHLPAGAAMVFYASTSSQRLADGSPAGGAAFSCSGQTAAESDYTCKDANAYALAPGATYFWWVVVSWNGSSWTYGPRTFIVEAPSATGAGATGGGGVSVGNNGKHSVADAPFLPDSPHFDGKSIKQTRLSQASYALTKLVGRPKTIAVACWNTNDWPGVSGDSGDGIYSTLGFYWPGMPHWINLSPNVCRGIETLLYHRPRYANATIATDLDTVTHEMVHALGFVDEAQTECYAMQLSIVMAVELGVPLVYANQLARLTLANYFLHPPRYIDTIRCRENGVWDLTPGKPAPPWHDYLG